MATTYLKISGKLKWINRLFEPDEYPKNNFNYKCYLYDVSEEDVAKLKAAGFRGNPKLDRDGDTVWSFKRPVSKVMKKEIVEFGPPEITGLIEGKLIGNGSEATVDIILYDTVMGKGHRLNKVHVTNFVEYKPEPDKGAFEE